MVSREGEANDFQKTDRWVLDPESNSGLIRNILKQKFLKSGEVWAMNIMPQGIMLVAASKKTAQIFVLMHSSRCGPSIKPCFDNLDGSRALELPQGFKNGVNSKAPSA